MMSQEPNIRLDESLIPDRTRMYLESPDGRQTVINIVRGYTGKVATSGSYQAAASLQSAKRGIIPESISLEGRR